MLPLGTLKPFPVACMNEILQSSLFSLCLSFYLHRFLFQYCSASLSLSLSVCAYAIMVLCVAREGAASRTGPETHNMGDGAERELPGKTGAPALGEQ